MTLANNHLNDFKVKPINYTVDELRKVGIKSFGYTFGPAEENRPQVCRVFYKKSKSPG